MTPFSDSLFNDAEYTPAAQVVSARGGTRPEPSQAAGQGTTLKASVQPTTLRRFADGNQVFLRGWKVYLRDDPSGLNGGLGVRGDDFFRYRGLLLVAEGPAEPPGADDCPWKVVCLTAE